MRRLHTPVKGETTAVLMAAAAGVDGKVFRGNLRKAELNWHRPNDRWTVAIGSPEHREMERVLASITSR